MYKTLFFDIDDTIFNFKLCSENALRETFNIYNIPFTEDIFKIFLEIDAALWAEQKQGKISVNDVLSKRFKILFNRLNINISSDKAKLTFKENLANEYIMEPSIYEIIVEYSKKYDIYAASNGTLKSQLNRLKLAGLLKYFTDVFVSDDIGYEKPNDNFFKECLRRSGLNPKDILFIGDSLQADILGAKNHNIDTCWYNPNNMSKSINVKTDYIIKNLAELKKIL